MAQRQGAASRQTTETTIDADVWLDGTGQARISTGVAFFDHMLELLATHSLFDVRVSAEGDVKVDDHHTVEDIGIVLGRCLDEALGDRRGIVRFADVAVPMDEALARFAVDLSGRGMLSYRVEFPTEKTGQFDTALVEEFMQALASNSRITLHVESTRGTNSHHIAEAVFKGVAVALRRATRVDPDRRGVPSSKGVL